jgi:hypothetical protein
MSVSIILIVLGFAFLFALLVLLLIQGKSPLWLKLLLIPFAAVFMLMAYHGWKDAQGWPSVTLPPEKFLLHAAVIEEPNAKKNDDGRIYIWLTSLVSQSPASTPRVHVVEYTEDLHAGLQDALRDMRKGNVQIASRKRVQDADQPPRDFNRLGEQRFSYEFTELPDPALPEK